MNSCEKVVGTVQPTLKIVGSVESPIGGGGGKDGVSPIVEITPILGGNRITITDVNGPKSTDIMDGKDGPKGDKGDPGEKGENGAQGPKGDKGDKGDTGAQGIQGIQGEKGADGAKGDKGDKGDTGANGKDGTSVTVKSVSESTADGGSNVVTFSDGKTLTVKNGSKGSAGKDGSDGRDGADGKTPVKGVDYFTEADKVEFLGEIDAVLYTAQTLTEAQKAQARANIGATAPTKVSELENDSGYLTELELTPEQLGEITEAVVEAQTINPADSVEWLNENGDTSKKYVLPDGFIYAYQKKYVYREHNANDGTGYLNANATGTWGNTPLSLDSLKGMWASPLIRIDTSAISPVGNPEGSSVTISGISKVVPVYNTAIRVIYYNSAGAQTMAKMGSEFISIGTNAEITLPKTFNLKDRNIFNDSNWANVYAVRIVLGISTSTITADDVADLKVNIPALNVNEEVQGWFSTGVSYVPSDNSAAIEKLQGDVDSLMAAVGKISITSDTVWYALGDSITAGYGVGLENAWYSYVKKINGYADNSVNLGVSSIGFKRVDLNYGKTIRNIVDENNFANCDLVTVAVGINDWTEQYSMDDVKTEMRYCFQKILTDNPYCKIIFIAPFNTSKYGTVDTNWAMGYSGGNTTGGTLRQFIDAQKTVCEEYGVQVIDLADCGVINRYNIQTVLYDNLHPNVNCHEALGKELARKITFA